MDQEGKSLFVFGTASRIFDDAQIASVIEQGAHLIPLPTRSLLPGDAPHKQRLVDRYDARLLLLDTDWDRALLSRKRKRDDNDQEAEEAGLLDRERYQDLPPEPHDLELDGQSADDEDRTVQAAVTEEQRFHAVAYSYEEEKSELSPTSHDAVPPQGEKTEFEKKVDRLLCHFIPDFQIPSQIKLPATPKVHKIIEETARFVTKQGPHMEAQILDLQRSNPNFGFLNPDDEFHEYYAFLRQRMALPTANAQPSQSAGSLQTLKTAYRDAMRDAELMDTIAAFVQANGAGVLDLLRERQANNPKFSFLKPADPNHALFVERLRKATNDPS